jgi:hypothetical protein
VRWAAWPSARDDRWHRRAAQLGTLIPPVLGSSIAAWRADQCVCADPGVAGQRPLFRCSDHWQLIINTGTTIVTFLMVFLIQNAQNRDARAIHLKLDGPIRGVKGALEGRQKKAWLAFHPRLRHRKTTLNVS